MKYMNVKLSIFIISFIIIIFNYNCTYASISENFKFIIDTIGVPRYNVYNDEINEEIYSIYNVFVYSNPNALVGKISIQRFKNVDNMGNWTLEGGGYKGYGIRGEYYLLGTNYSGEPIHNVYFPADYVPETTPDKWNYQYIQGAYESWQDSTKYKYIDQLNFMKNTGLLFDEINFQTNTSNSYNLIPYNITANSIGLDKVVLNTCSTWKTMGVVDIKRKNNKGQIRYAILATTPMAASAQIKSKLNISDKYILDSDKIDINIPIGFGCEVINLNNYAKKEHIKEICSIVYINNKEVARISGSKTVNMDKIINFAVSRNEYESPKTYEFQVRVSSYLYTEFYVDGLLQNMLEKTIYVEVKPKKQNLVTNGSIKLLKQTNTNLWVVSPLVQTYETRNVSSQGFVEAGKHIALKLDLNTSYKDVVNLEVYINGSIVESKNIKTFENSVILDIKVPNILECTLMSWNYLRDKIGNYFNINFDMIGNRIREANILKVVVYFKNSSSSMEFKFDSIDEYNKNFNYIFNNRVLNFNEIKSEITLDEWYKI
ncbi:MAG: hypothetical protein N2749_05725 [Clostridia bacterium]|nr:hypothetical protein [Clostridia bacterium]